MHNRSCENEFYLHENENHFHMKGWALNLVSIQRPRGTRKWPIVRFPREGQHIFFPNWAIPENIHTQPRTASMFQPPLAFRNSKMCYPPCPQNSIIMNLPYLSEFPFFWKYIFDLAMPIWTNEHEFMPPQGCDLAAPGDKLYSSVTRKTYASCQAVQTPF